MAKFIVQGGSPLHGDVLVGGSKNAVLPILAATLLATKPVTLRRVPAIRDVGVMLQILRHFGMDIKGESGTITLDPAKLAYARVPDDLAKSLRASILLLGPALARFGEYESVHPGGDVIGLRPLDTHFKALTQLGAAVTHDHARYHVTATKLTGATVFLEEASVTATENMLMVASAATGPTIIKNAASELHVRDLATFLRTLGANIVGAGTNKVTITGKASFGGGVHEVRADELEAATFIIAAAVTGGTLTLQNVDPEHFGLILIKLREAGINLESGENTITVKPPHTLRATNLKTGLWPGFPSDLASPYTVLMTQAEGTSIIHDWLYEGRFFYTDKLATMGATITMADPHRIIVTGPTALVGRELNSPDIRAGMTMLVAALIARGETIIDHAEHIDRGYEGIDRRLRELGATITRA